MKTWIAKLRISLALDCTEPPAKQVRKARSGCDDIRRFEESIGSLDRRLKAAPPTDPIPAALHASVMRAVRAASTKSQEQRPAWWFLRWLPAPALALLVGLVAWWSLNRSPHEPPSLAVAATALAQSHDIAQKAPEVVLAPLALEMNNLNRDFQNAVEFLVASVP